jgi:hypothetical protein
VPGYQVQYPTGHVVEFDHMPQPDEVARVGQQFGAAAQQQEQAPQTSTLGNIAGSVGSAVAHGGLDILSGVSYGLGKTQQALSGGEDNEFLKAAKSENLGDENAYGPQIDKFFAEHGMKPTGMGKTASEIGGGVLPFVNPITGITSIANQLSGSAYQRQAAGVDESTANTGMAVEGGGMLAGALAGAKVAPGGLVGKSIGAMVGAGMAARGSVAEYLKSAGYDKQAAAGPAWNDPESILKDAISGLVFHASLGHGPEEQKTIDPAQDAGKTASDMLKETGQPDPSLTDVDTSGQRSQFNSIRREDMPDAQFGAHAADAEAQNAGVTAPETEGLPSKPTSKTGSPSIEGNQVSGKTQKLADIPDTFKIEHLDQALELTRQEVADRAAKDTSQDTMQDGSERPLTPEEQRLENENRAQGAHTSDMLDSRQSDLFWNGVGQAKDMTSMMSEPDAQGRRSVDPIKALKWMQNYSAPHIKEVAEKLLKFPELLNQLKITTLGEKEFNGGANKGGAAGMYRPATHDILLGSKLGIKDQVIAHEIVHAVSARGVIAGTYLSRQFPKLAGMVKGLQAHLDALHEIGGRQETPETTHPNGAGEPAKVTHDFSKDFGQVGRGRVYGLHDVNELIAESFTNKNFRELLQKYGTWDAIKKTLAKAFGTEPTALDRVLEMSHGIMQETTARRQDISAELRKLYSNAGWTDTVKVLYSGARDSVEQAKDRGLDEDPKTKAVTSGLPGGGKLKAADIPAAPKTSSILAALKQAQDIKNNLGTLVTKNFTVSGEQLANLWRQPGLYQFARIFDRAQKLGHLADETITKPLRRQIKELIPDSNVGSLKRVMDVMHAEDFYKDAINPDGKRLTPEQLEKALNPKERQVYSLLRDAYDKSFDKVNAALKEMGQEPVSRRAAYTASSRKGPWSAEVHRDWVDKETGEKRSEMVGYITGHSISEVRKGLEFAKKQPGVTRTTEPTFKKGFNGRSDNLFQSYDAVSRLLGPEDPATKSIRAALDQHAAASGMNFEGYKRHLMDKSGLRYAEGDRPWLTDRKNVQDWYKNQLEAIQHGHEWAEMQKAVKQAGEVMHDPELQSTHPNMANYLREYARSQMGFGKNEHISAIENKIAETMGRIFDTIPGFKNLPSDVQAGMVVMREAKSLLYLKALGFWKPQHFLVNGVFQPMFTAARHMKISAEGFDHNPFTTFHEGMLNAQAILLNHYTDGKFQLNEHQQKLADYIKSNNIATNNPFQDTGDIGQNSYSKVDSTLRKYGGFMMQEGERVARINAIASFESHLRQSGKFDNQLELFREAERQTTETMGSFRHTDRPQAFVKMGITGTGLATLRQFEINFLNQFHDYIKFGIEKKNFAPLLAFSATQLMMAGVMGFIGFQTLDDVWKFVRDMIPTSMVSKEFATWSPKKFVLENAPMILSRGPVSSLTGINFASSLEAGTIVDPSVQGMIPFISEIKNTVGPAFSYATNPTSDNLHKMIWNETPYGSRGVLETGKFLGQDLPDAINTKSWYNSPNGTSQSPNNPGQGTYKRDAEDTAIRSAGFTSTQEAMTKEGEFMSKEDSKVLEERQKDIMDNLGSAVRNHDFNDIGKYAQQYVQMAGNPQTAFGNDKFLKLAMDWNTDYKQKVALGASSGDLTAIYKYQRLHEMLDQVEKYYGPANAANKGR